MAKLRGVDKKIDGELDSDKEAVDQMPVDLSKCKSRIMYIEDKSSGLEGTAAIGRVYFSKSGKTLYYKEHKFKSLKGAGFKSNYFEVETGDEYWISGPKKDMNDRLYGGNMGVMVDPDVESEYRRMINDA